VKDGVREGERSKKTRERKWEDGIPEICQLGSD